MRIKINRIYRVEDSPDFHQLVTYKSPELIDIEIGLGINKGLFDQSNENPALLSDGNLET